MFFRFVSQAVGEGNYERQMSTNVTFWAPNWAQIALFVAFWDHLGKKNGKNWKNLKKFDQKWMEILRICFPTFIMAE